MAKELGGYEFDCCLRDMFARQVFFAGCSSPQEISFLRGVLQPGMTFVDVGANWGLFTLTASYRVGSQGRVVALEPDPRIFRMLRSNVERNRLKQVQIFEVAAADRDSELTLAAHDPDGENWAISRLVDSRATQQPTFQVASRRLDHLLDEMGTTTVDLVKIDVEGAEDLVLVGMDAGLTGLRYRCILLEMHPVQLGQRGRTLRSITDALVAKGYRGYSLDHSPQASRRAYYHPWLDFSNFIQSLEQGMSHGQPHTIWLSPGEKDFL
jgi:FkbM family methyltransferase